MSDVLLQVSDWNCNDKYYKVPVSVLSEFAGRVRAGTPIRAVWDWFLEQERAGLVVRCDEAADHTLEEEFFDYWEPLESVSCWEV